MVPRRDRGFHGWWPPSVSPKWAQQQQYNASSAGFQMPPSSWQLFQSAGTCRSQPGQDASGAKLKSG